MASQSKKSSNAVIKSLRLTARTGATVDLDTYMLELNIHEDIFGNSVSGTLVISDSRNLNREMSLEGEETLYIHISTHGLPDDEPAYIIQKEFRVYNVTNRTIATQKSTQSYILHFCSKELMRNALTPLFLPFDGTITEVVTELFETYVQIPRYPGGPENELLVIDETTNPVKFISPGWSPFKCINWLASKSISENGRACNYLFWETTKQYVFGSVESIFQDLAETEVVAGYYKYREKDDNIQDILVGGSGDGEMREFVSVNQAEMLNVNDALKLVSEGDIASTALTIDINRKEFKNTIYQHPEDFRRYTHLMDNDTGQAIWSIDFQNNPKNAIYFTPKNTHLFDEFDNNVNEVYSDIFGKRIANLRDINNFKINIAVSGRTDIQAGTIIHLQWPDTLEKANDGITDSGDDIRYTGYYMISAIRHKFTIFNYLCILEVVKDIFNENLTDGTEADYTFEGDATAADAELTAQIGVA